MPSLGAADEVYARQLFPSQRGYPLFIPEPNTNLPSEFTDRGVDVGDVGIIKNGLFYFVFSVCAAADDPVNHVGVPDGFQRFRPNERLFSKYPNMHKKGSELTSSSITKHKIAVDGGLKENPLLSIPAGGNVGYTLKSSFSEAAVLNMPDGASSVDYGGLKELRSYAIRNGESWYDFINGELGLEAPNGSLYLVTGCDKSTTWGIASVSHGSSSNTIALRFTAAQTVQASASYTFSWETDCPAFARTGPDLSDDDSLPQNQCLFVRGLKVRVRDNAVVRQVKGAIQVESTEDMKPSSLSSAKRSNSFPGTSSSRQPSPTSSSSSRSSSGHQDFEDTPNTSDDEWSSDEEELDHTHEAYHPLNAIEEYLLETTNARVVVTHESDWWPLSQGDVLPNDDELLERLPLHFNISTEADGAYLVPISTSVKPQSDAIEAEQAEFIPDPCILAFPSPTLVETTREQTHGLSPTLEPSGFVPPFYDLHQHNSSLRDPPVRPRMAKAFDRMSQGNRAPPPTHDPTREADPRDPQVAPGSMSRGYGSVAVDIEDEASQERSSLQREITSSAPKWKQRSQFSAKKDETQNAQAATGSVGWEYELTASFDDFHNHHTNFIGGGGFGAVWMGHYLPVDRCIAVKSVRLMPILSKDNKKHNQRVMRELALWQRLEHKNIVPLLGIFPTPIYPAPHDPPYWVMPYYRNNKLLDYMATRHPDEWLAWAIQELGRRLDFLHGNGVIHGDLKSDILVSDAGRAQIADFGVTVMPELCSGFTTFAERNVRHQILCDVATGMAYLHSQDIIHGDLTCKNVLIDDNGPACFTDFGLSIMRTEFYDTCYLTSALRIAPILTFADTVLWNWELINRMLPVNIDNMLSHIFSGTDDERTFYVTSARAELGGVEMLCIFNDYQNLPNVNDLTSVSKTARNLNKLAGVIDKLTEAIKGVRAVVDPHVFYWEVRPWFEGSQSRGPDEPKWIYEDCAASDTVDLSGPSAGQSSVMHALDINHKLKEDYHDFNPKLSFACDIYSPGSETLQVPSSRQPYYKINSLLDYLAQHHPDNDPGDIFLLKRINEPWCDRPRRAASDDAV